MGFALGHELRPHGATAVSLTPGWLRSEAMLDAFKVTEANWHDATRFQPHFAISETPAFVGRAVAALAQDPHVARWNGMSLSSGQLAKVYGFTDLDGSQPDALALPGRSAGPGEACGRAPGLPLIGPALDPSPVPRAGRDARRIASSQVPFQAHIELLQFFLAHRDDIVERIEGVLNAQRKPIEYLQDGSLLSRLFEDCFFTLLGSPTTNRA